MSHPTRDQSRNVFFVLTPNIEDIRGGVDAGPQYTKNDFLTMLCICLDAPNGFMVVSDDGQVVEDSSDLLEKGVYIVKSAQEDVRHRDGGCMISGAVAKGADRDIWLGFEAAHIVPVAHEAVFPSSHLDAYVTDRTGINSPQNGILMKADLRQLFDQYFFAINPFVSPLHRSLLLVRIWNKVDI
ncbi:hypothetical protein MW887_004966 [Aspergillus wentii]|nr:hypothetical protein MW887_004966 [Aspergillus wentii]